MTIFDSDLPRVPQPDGKPTPLFFGRRFLTYRDLIEIGFVNNAMTLRRLIAEGRFPPPLALGRQIRLWDALELQALVDRLAAERNGKRTDDLKRKAADFSAAEQHLLPATTATVEWFDEIPKPCR
jgi:hypothetical protein